MLPNVAERRRTEERVAEGMRKRVAVRMPYRPFIKRNAHASQNEFSSCGKTVHIVAKTNPMGTASLWRILLGRHLEVSFRGMDSTFSFSRLFGLARALEINEKPGDGQIRGFRNFDVAVRASQDGYLSAQTLD